MAGDGQTLYVVEPMIVRLERYGPGSKFPPGPESTLGKMFVPDIGPCYTLEDQWQAEKMAHETRIPDGVYALSIHPASRFDAAYAKRFPKMHRGMILLNEVPDFAGVLVHCGNNDDETSGCILVGEAFVRTPSGDYVLGRSADAYSRMYPKIVDAILAGGASIEVTTIFAPLPVVPVKPPIR